ncbi:MAG: thioesterase [Turicibacter sp.]|nr:thioesterase [Turicibacter sp.]
MIYQHERQIGFFDLDSKEEVRLTALIKYINDASWYSAGTIGAGMDDTLKSGMVFVLQRMGIQFFGLPKLDETVTIKTWPGEMTRSAFKRRGEILSATGDKLVEWESMWVLIDIEARRIKRPTDFPTELPVYGKLGVEVEADRVKIPEDAAELASYTHLVQYSELDILGHMNSAIYADLIANVLSKVEKQSLVGVKEIQFNYINEAKADDEIAVDCQALDGVLYISGAKVDGAVFTAEIKC